MNHIVLIKVKGRLDPILSYIKRFGLSELTDPVTRDISNKENSTEIN